MYKSTNIGSYFINKQQIKLYFRTWIPVNVKGLLIFVHGAGQHSGLYSHLGTECLRRQIALVAPDLRGFGQSGGKRGHIHRFQDYLDDLDELITRLQKQYSGLPVYLFGHSLGGLVVIRFVQHFSDKATGVILSSPALAIHLTIPYFIKKCVELVTYLTPSLSLEVIKWNESLRKLKWFRSNLPSWTSELLNDPLATIRYTPRWFTELLHNGARALSEVNKFHFPALCLYDLHDPIVNAELIELFIESISSEDKASIVFDEGDHQPLLGYRKNEAIEHIFQWLYPRL